MRRRRIGASAALTLMAAAAAACSTPAPAHNGADDAFLARMIPHHERAIAVARLALTQGSDARVRTFAARIVREQTPELAALQSSARGHDVDTRDGAEQATDRISDAQVTALRAEHGAAFDRRFVSLNVTSEQGAYAMARTELSDGTGAAPRRIALSISHSPSEIRELQALARQLS